MLDSRSRRVVDGRRRLMADEGEWHWLTEAVSGDWEHVVLATSVPPLLPRGIHTLEAWSERVCDGAWGRRFARFGERLRREVDLEHWPAFGASFVQLERLLTALATGRHSPDGRPPASVTVVTGDIHHSYLAEVDLPRRGAPARASGARRAGRRRPRGGLLALPPGHPAEDEGGAAVASARAQRPARHRRRHPGRRVRAADPLADHPRPVVREHDRVPRVRRPGGPRPLRPLRPRPAGTPRLATAADIRLS